MADINKLRILYVGSMNPNSNSFRRFNSLEQLGHVTLGIDVDKPIYGSKLKSFHHHLNVGPGIWELNRQVCKALTDFKPDMLWVDNKSFLTASTIRKARSLDPSIKIINVITDDITGTLRYAWRLSIKTASLFDNHFVQRKVNIDELYKVGARNVDICYRSYDPAFHRVIELSDADHKKYYTPVGFIGTYESFREEFIAYLIQNNIPVHVTGNDWPEGKNWNIIKPFYRGPSVYGDEYIKHINGMDISLHFLRHGNRDEQDSRTFEIPACGAFMLGERSELHLQLFEDGKDAVFFETMEELLKKVKYYLSHDVEREQIANNGLLRCRSGNYSHEGRLKEVIKKVYADKG